LVVAIVQATDYALRYAVNNFKLEDNGGVPPLIIFYQQSMRKRQFWYQRMLWAAGWLRRFLQAATLKQG
jgi:hypothetical protein